MKSIKALIERIPYQIRASFVILVASFITSAISFITTPIFTRLLSIEEYGLVTQYNSVLEVVTVIATLSLSAGVFQVAMNEFSEDRNGFTFSVLLLSNIATIAVFAVIFLFRNSFSSFLHLPEALILCMFLFLMFNPATQLWMAKQRYEYQYKKVAIVSIITVAFNLGSSLTAVIVLKKYHYNLAYVKIWVTAIAQIISALIIYCSIAKKANWKINWSYVKYAFVFNAPLLVHYLAQYILRSSDKIMITSICGERATGLYGLGSTVASLAMLAWAAMAASLTPYIYSHLKTNEYLKINKAVISVIGIFGICCFLVSMTGPEIVFILGSKKYIENIQLIPPIAASSLLAAIYGVYSTIAFYHHKRTSTAIMTIIAAVINIVLNLILIPRYGYIAAAYTTEIAYLIYTVLHFINYRRIVREDKVYNDKGIWIITILTTGLCLLTGFIYNYWIIRYAIVALIVIAALIFRRRLLAIIKTIMGR